MRLRTTLALILLLLSGARAQDTAVLDGEPAIRFLVGHGHLTNYCEGELWITATRLRFDGVSDPRHSFDFRRAEVKDAHAASAFGFHYLKISAGGETFRMGIYPELEHALGDRFRLAEKAFRDFPAAYAEVKAVEQKRSIPAGLLAVADNPGGPTLRVAVLVTPDVAWFSGPKGVAVWSGPEADKRAYGEIHFGRESGKPAGFSSGTLEITAERVRLTEVTGGQIALDEPRAEMRLKEGAGGYPQVVVAFRHAGRLTFMVGRATHGGLDLYDATPLLRALGDEFPQVVEEVRKAPAKQASSRRARRGLAHRARMTID